MGKTLHAVEAAPGRPCEVLTFVETLIADPAVDAIRGPGGVEYVRSVTAVELPPEVAAFRAPGGRVFVQKAF